AHVSTPQIKKEWINYGTGNTPFNRPRGIAVDNAGNVYVADSENHRIVKFDNSDAYVTQWGSFGSGDFQLNNPRGMAMDGNGAVYVVDFSNHRIKKYTTTGLFISKWGGPNPDTGDGQFYFPTFVAVGNGGAIVVSDTSNLRVQKFACDNSNYFAKWGLPGTGDGEFNRPMGIALDRLGNVYVADTYNNRIQKFSSTGALLFKWGRLDAQPGSGDTEFNHPTGVAVDDEGSIYVADRDNNRVLRLSATGQFIWKYPDHIRSPYDRELNHPTNVAWDGIYWWVVDADMVWGWRLTDPLGPEDGSHLGYLYPRSVLVDRDIIYVTTLADPNPGIRKFNVH